MTIFLTIVFMLVSLALTITILMQEGKSAGFSGAINGVADTYWGRNKGRSMEGMLEKLTKILAVAFFVIALLLNIFNK